MNILLVEDNPADVRLVREALAEGDVPANLDWVHSGEEAVAHLRYGVAAAKRFATDLVLLDLNLPGMNGHEVLSVIKSDPELRHIPVIVLSSSASRHDVLSAYRSYVNAYVVKPDDFEQYLQLIGSIESYWRSTATLPTRMA
jgi:two-component system, chemotaxis family, response regulator Rcp1